MFNAAHITYVETIESLYPGEHGHLPAVGEIGDVLFLDTMQLHEATCTAVNHRLHTYSIITGRNITMELRLEYPVSQDGGSGGRFVCL